MITASMTRKGGSHAGKVPERKNNRHQRCQQHHSYRPAVIEGAPDRGRCQEPTVPPAPGSVGIEAGLAVGGVSAFDVSI